MIAGLLVAAVTLTVSMYGVYRLECWSTAREARLARQRAEDAVILNHPGADEAFAVQLRSWLDAGQSAAVAR